MFHCIFAPACILLMRCSRCKIVWSRSAALGGGKLCIIWPLTRCPVPLTGRHTAMLTLLWWSPSCLTVSEVLVLSGQFWCIKRNLKTEPFDIALNVNTQPSICCYMPLIGSSHMAQYTCVLVDWLYGDWPSVLQHCWLDNRKWVQSVKESSAAANLESFRLGTSLTWHSLTWSIFFQVRQRTSVVSVYNTVYVLLVLKSWSRLHLHRLH